jgi:hypothetical protein
MLALHRSREGPQGLKPVYCPIVAARLQEAAEKLHRTGKGDHRGLKPAQIPGNLPGPEGPLFYCDARIREFFRNLLKACPFKASATESIAGTHELSRPNKNL